MAGKFRIWLRAVRPQFFTATLVPILLGGIMAWHQLGAFNWPYFLFALVGGLFIHAGLDLANDYFDHASGVDDINPFPSPFSGGTQVIQEKLLSPYQVLGGSIFCLVAGVIIGLYLNFILPGNLLLFIGIIGTFLVWFYTAPPLRIGYTGFGELATGLGFGPVMVVGSYYVQTAELSWLPFLASIPIALLIALVLYINEFPDYEADRKVDKRTLVVILGKKRAIKLYYLLLGFVYLWVVSGVITRTFPYFALIVLATLPLCFKAIKVAKSNYNEIYELLPANASTIGLHLTIGLLLSGSYILDKIFHG